MSILYVPTIENALKIKGWMTQDELRWLAKEAANHFNIVEIGSWRGRSTRALADNCSGRITAVDGFVGSPFDTPDGMWPDMAAQIPANDPDYIYNEFMKNVGYLAKVRTLRMLSLEGAVFLHQECAQFDMIFIDAGHDYEHVKEDILAWRPLLAPGGLFCGHDYFNGCPGVIQAVNELVPNRMQGAGTIWYSRAA